MLSNTCGNLPQGGFTSSDQAIFIVASSSKLRPFSVSAVYAPILCQHDTDLPSSQSARIIGPRPASWQSIVDSMSSLIQGYELHLTRDALWPTIKTASFPALVDYEKTRPTSCRSYTSLHVVLPQKGA
jgi:hypothetical protein